MITVAIMNNYFVLTGIIALSLILYGCSQKSIYNPQDNNNILKNDTPVNNVSSTKNPACTEEINNKVIIYLRDNFNWIINDTGYCYVEANDTSRLIIGYSHVRYRNKELELYVYQSKINDSIDIKPWVEQGDVTPDEIKDQVDKTLLDLYGNKNIYLKEDLYRIYFERIPNEVEVGYSVLIPSYEGFSDSTAIWFTRNGLNLQLINDSSHLSLYNFSLICPNDACHLDINKSYAIELFQKYRNLSDFDVILSTTENSGGMTACNCNRKGYRGMIWQYRETWKVPQMSNSPGFQTIAELNPYTGELYTP